MKPLPTHDLDEIATRCADVFKALDGAHVLITGHTGFVGSWMWSSGMAAQRAGHDLRISGKSRSESVYLGPGCRTPPGDAQGYSTPRGPDIRQLVIPEGVTHVIHCASAASAAENAADSRAVCDMIYYGTERVVDECERVGVSRLLLLSSGSVYAPKHDGAAYTETDTVGGRDRFGRTKWQAENYALGVDLFGEKSRVHSPVPTVVARGFAMLGPRLPPQFAAAQFMADALAGRPIRVTHPGTVRSYLYAADLACWLWTLLVKGEAGTAYNVGGSTPVCVGNIAANIFGEATLLQGKGTIYGDAAPSAPFVPDTTRAQALGLTDWTTGPEALRRWWAWERGV